MPAIAFSVHAMDQQVTLSLSLYISAGCIYAQIRSDWRRCVPRDLLCSQDVYLAHTNRMKRMEMIHISMMDLRKLEMMSDDERKKKAGNNVKIPCLTK